MEGRFKEVHSTHNKRTHVNMCARRKSNNSLINLILSTNVAFYVQTDYDFTTTEIVTTEALAAFKCQLSFQNISAHKIIRPLLCFLKYYNIYPLVECTECPMMF